jgi:hypothetical protein
MKKQSNINIADSTLANFARDANSICSVNIYLSQVLDGLKKAKERLTELKYIMMKLRKEKKIVSKHVTIEWMKTFTICNKLTLLKNELEIKLLTLT